MGGPFESNANHAAMRIASSVGESDVISANLLTQTHDDTRTTVSTPSDRNSPTSFASAEGRGRDVRYRAIPDSGTDEQLVAFGATTALSDRFARVNCGVSEGRR